MFGGVAVRNVMTAAPPDGYVVKLVTTTVSQSIDYETSDPVLTHLEDRIRSWLSQGIAPSPRTQQTRVTKLYRSPVVEVRMLGLLQLHKYEVVGSAGVQRNNILIILHATHLIRLSSISN